MVTYSNIKSENSNYFLLLLLELLEEEITIKCITLNVCVKFEEMAVAKTYMGFVFQLFLLINVSWIIKLCMLPGTEEN